MDEEDINLINIIPRSQSTKLTTESVTDVCALYINTADIGRHIDIVCQCALVV